MPWVRVTGRVIDTSKYRARAGSHTSTSRSALRQSVPGAQAEPVSEGATTTPQRMSRTSVHCAEASPCTAHMPSKKQSRRTRGDDDDDDDDDERNEWRTRMVFRDLLCEFYPRYGVSLKEEFGKSFKAARTEATFSAFPEPRVSGVVFR